MITRGSSARHTVGSRWVAVDNTSFILLRNGIYTHPTRGLGVVSVTSISDDESTNTIIQL